MEHDASRWPCPAGRPGSPYPTPYAYDADGIRTQYVDEDNATTNYVTDKNQPYAQVLYELDAADALDVRYIHGDDLLAQVRGATPTWRYYHYDGQMSVRQLTHVPADPGTEQASATDWYTYDAFGTTLDQGYNPLLQTGYTKNDFRYTGEQRDNTGFYYLRARYYNPQDGRFITRDPFGGSQADPVTLHKYLYAGANPISYWDPSGRYLALLGGISYRTLKIYAAASAALLVLALVFKLYRRITVSQTRTINITINIDARRKPRHWNSTNIEKELNAIMDPAISKLPSHQSVNIKLVEVNTQPVIGWNGDNYTGWVTFGDFAVRASSGGEGVTKISPRLTQEEIQAYQYRVHSWDLVWANALAHEQIWLSAKASRDLISAKTIDTSILGAKPDVASGSLWTAYRLPISESTRKSLLDSFDLTEK